jgi:5-methylcytosine-specific restriction enzyme subunit McrC
MTPLRVLPAVEHGPIEGLADEEIHYLPQPDDGDISKVWAFGLSPGGYLSYYIGLDWLDEEMGIALRVAPKVGGADYHAMLWECLESPEASRYLGDAYDIREERAYIDSEEDESEVLPLLVIHYLMLLERLLRKPLKKGYVSHEENLQLRIKGKILLSEQMTKNVFAMRPDRIMCRWQEYSTDCPENRLLHSAYNASMQFLRQWARPDRRYRKYELRFSVLGLTFSGIGIVERESELQAIRRNPVYREYGEALRLARLIYMIRGYRERQGYLGRHKVPPYIIDMSRLFELYVYAQLTKVVGHDIGYQVHGVGGGIVDFLDYKRKLVIDAKYKPVYEDGFDMDNMRQVAGYARNTSMLDKLNVEDKDRVVDCLIIYPDTKASDLSYVRYEGWRATPIEQYHRIYKLGIALPLKDEA